MTERAAPTTLLAAPFLALAAVLALEAGLSLSNAWCAPAFYRAVRETPVNRHPTMARDVFFDDCRLRRCRADGRPPVIFLGGSPTMGLDLPHLETTFAAVGAQPLLWTYPSGVFPPELIALRSSLLALKPRALVVAMGPALFPYSGRLSTRLAFLPMSGRLLEALGSSPWRLRRLLARAALANAVKAFRYRFLLRRLLPALPGQQEWVLDLYQKPPDLFEAAVGEIELQREQGERLFESFVAGWKETGVPLIFWEAPRVIGGATRGPVAGREDTARYEALMRRLAAAHGFRYLASSEEPTFGPNDFKNPTHLTDEASARLTRFLAREVSRGLAPR